MSALDGVLGFGRRHAEARMTEQVAVGRYVDSTDPATGDPIRTLQVARYVGAGRIRYPSNSANETSGPGEPVATQKPYLSIPVGSDPLYEGDEVLVTGSTTDPAGIVGRQYRVTGRAVAGQVTAARYPLEEVS